MGRRIRNREYPQVEVTFKRDGRKETFRFMGYSSTSKSIKVVRNGMIEYLQLKQIEFKEV